MSALAQFSQEPGPHHFDYDQLAPDVAQEARTAAGRIRGFLRASVIDVGRELLEVKEHLDHGQFRAWVERECGLPIRTAERLMQAATVVGKNVNLTYLTPDGLLALAARTAPRPAVDAIIDRIDAGERPTAAEIKRELATAKRQVRAVQPDAEGTCREVVPDPASSPRDQEPVTEHSPEQQLDGLMRAWDQAGEDARRWFLQRIGAVTSQSRNDAAAPVEHCEPDHEQKQRLPVTAPSENLVALPSRPPGATVRSDPGRVPPAVHAERLAPSQAAPEEPSPESQVSSELSPVDTSAESWAGREPPPEIICASPSGKCGYGACGQQRRCLKVRGLAAA